MKIKQHLLKPFSKLRLKPSKRIVCYYQVNNFFKFDELFVSTNQVGGVIKEGREPSETIHVICLHYYLR